MDKQRFLLLPAGTQIDNTDRARWRFPAGTLLTKTFFDDTGPTGAPRPIETRLIRAVGNEQYQFFVYQWHADGTDAKLVVNDVEGDPNADLRVPVTIDRTIDGARFTLNGGQPFEHTLPSRNACGQCHEANAAVTQTVIGFDELRLNSKRTPVDAMTQLEALDAADVFTNPPPATPAGITDVSEDGGRLLRIKRFVFGNCVSCHNGESVVDLRPEVFVENTVNKPTEAQSVRPPEGWLRVVPGDPARSVLYVQLERSNLPEPELGSNRLRAMPPVGLSDVAVEPTSLQDTFDWIRSLAP